MLSKLIANPTGYDLIQPSEYTVEHLIGEKLLTPLDFSRIPNVKNLALDMRDLPYDPGQKYSVPYMSGTVGIVVNTDAVKEPIRGYADVFQEKYRQRIVVVDDNREIVSWAMSVHGIPINDVTPANLEKVTPTLKQWLALVKVFAPATPAPPLLGGEADIGVIYSGDAAALMAKDKRFTYVLPREGAHRFVDNLCIPAGAKHKEEAERFIDYVLRPQVSKIISDKFPYTNPNAEARKLLTREQLENPASYPPGGAQHLEVFHDIGPGAREISTLMTELRSR
jgi:spermidine/putrescine transport system substrate-binding protein